MKRLSSYFILFTIAITLSLSSAYAVGTTSFDGEIFLTNGNINIDVSDTAGATGLRTFSDSFPQDWIFGMNPNTGRLTITDVTSGNTPFKIKPDAAENLLRLGFYESNVVDINGAIAIIDGMVEPMDNGQRATIYIDSVDDKLKIKFSDNSVFTIVLEP